MASAASQGLLASKSSAALPSHARVTKQEQLRDYKKRLHDAVRTMLENFSHILKLAKLQVDEAPSSQILRLNQIEQDLLEMSVRAGNITHAAEALMKLIDELKLNLILNSIPKNDDMVDGTHKRVQTAKENLCRQLLQTRERLNRDFHDLEDDFYLSSLVGTTTPTSVGSDVPSQEKLG